MRRETRSDTRFKAPKRPPVRPCRRACTRKAKSPPSTSIQYALPCLILIIYTNSTCAKAPTGSFFLFPRPATVRRAATCLFACVDPNLHQVPGLALPPLHAYFKDAYQYRALPLTHHISHPLFLRSQSAARPADVHSPPLTGSRIRARCRRHVSIHIRPLRTGSDWLGKRETSRRIANGSEWWIKERHGKQVLRARLKAPNRRLLPSLHTLL